MDQTVPLVLKVYHYFFSCFCVAWGGASGWFPTLGSTSGLLRTVSAVFWITLGVGLFLKLHLCRFVGAVVGVLPWVILIFGFPGERWNPIALLMLVLICWHVWVYVFSPLRHLFSTPVKMKV